MCSYLTVQTNLNPFEPARSALIYSGALLSARFNACE
jgi:hypothetical protein